MNVDKLSRFACVFVALLLLNDLDSELMLFNGCGEGMWLVQCLAGLLA